MVLDGPVQVAWQCGEDLAEYQSSWRLTLSQLVARSAANAYMDYDATANEWIMCVCTYEKPCVRLAREQRDESSNIPKALEQLLSTGIDRNVHLVTLPPGFSE